MSANHLVYRLLGEADAAGTFFYDHQMLYAYAGINTSVSNSVTNSLWAFNTSANTWALTTIAGGNIQFNNNSEGEHTSYPGLGLSFYTGGFGIGINGSFDGIVTFDSSSSEPNWNFKTQDPASEVPPSILKGGMEFIRRGKSGTLVAFGGFDVGFSMNKIGRNAKNTSLLM